MDEVPWAAASAGQQRMHYISRGAGKRRGDALVQLLGQAAILQRRRPGGAAGARRVEDGVVRVAVVVVRRRATLLRQRGVDGAARGGRHGCGQAGLKVAAEAGAMRCRSAVVRMRDGDRLHRVHVRVHNVRMCVRVRVRVRLRVRVQRCQVYILAQLEHGFLEGGDEAPAVRRRV